MLEAKASFHRELPEQDQMKEGPEDGRFGVSAVTRSSGSLQRTGLLTEVNTIFFFIHNSNAFLAEHWIAFFFSYHK